MVKYFCDKCGEEPEPNDHLTTFCVETDCELLIASLCNICRDKLKKSIEKLSKSQFEKTE